MLAVYRKMMFRFMAVGLSVLILAFALSPVGAQTGDAAAQRAALTQMLYTQATGLLARYNIPAGALDEFLPLISQGDQQGLLDALGSYGLNQDQVQAILGEAAPLI